MAFEHYELVGGDPGSYSGGFSFPKNPLITIVDKDGSLGSKVSDLFVGLAVPYWAFSQKAEYTNNVGEVDDDKVIDDDLYNKLFDSVQHYAGERKKSRRQTTERRRQTKKNRS